MLSGGLDRYLVIELGELLAAGHVVETAHEELLQTRLHDRGHRNQFAGDDAVASDPGPIDSERQYDCREDHNKDCARPNPPQPPNRLIDFYGREHGAVAVIWSKS